MACNNSYKNTIYISAQTAYNNAAQAFVVAGTPISILGNLVCDTGCAINTNAGGFNILKTGLYRISYDVTATPTTAGQMAVQLYNGTTALPCAISTVTAVADDAETIHVETTLRFVSCCGVTPMINAQISGTVGTVNHVCASVVKLA